MTPITYSVAQAAHLLGISERQVYRLVETKRLPKMPDLGRLTRIPRIAVEQKLVDAMGEEAARAAIDQLREEAAA